MSTSKGRDEPAVQHSPGGELNTAPEKVPAHASTVPQVLIAEDEEPIAAALVLIVEDAGYTPLVAVHGREALEMQQARRPALVITDLMMPYLDGTELIAAIRADAEQHAYKRPPIVLMTAAGLRRAQEAGADALLRKPFNIEDVEAVLRRFLGGARRQTDSGELLP